MRDELRPVSPLSGSDAVSAAGRSFPIVDYEQHPAFGNHALSPRPEDAEIHELVERINQALHGVSIAAASGSRRAVVDGFEKITPSFDRLDSLLDQALRSEPSLCAAARQALQATRHYLTGDALFSAEKLSYCRDRQGQVNGVAAALDEQGFAITSVPQEHLDRLRKATASAYDELLERARRDPYRRLMKMVPLDSEVASLVIQYVRSAAIDDAVERYCGHDMQIDSVLVEYSHEGSTWYRDCYGDVGLGTSSAVYMHCDYEYQRHKMTIYLNEVGSEQGPFSYVRGSHRLPRAEFQFVFFKELDQVLHRTLKEAVATDPYYRPMFKQDEYRRRFMRLPRALRGTSHFGDDLLDDSAASTQLLHDEVPITTDRGNCIVFDGHMGIHRGGLVQRGERLVVHAGFGQRLSVLQRAVRKMQTLTHERGRGQ
jgi:hypothetical protein